MHAETNESSCIGKEPCPSCGSRDNLGRYSDGHGFCFGCGHYEHGDGGKGVDAKSAPSALLTGEYQPLLKRNINEETCKKWGYSVGEYNGKKVQIATYRDESGKPVAQKLRFADKTFTTLGDFKQAGLYGQHLWRDGGKMVVITEGEIDALTVSQLQNNKWPVVSLPNGAQGAKKALQKNVEWLEKFDAIVLMFDNDEPGQKATAECVTLFTPGKCKIAALPLKDANEMHQAGRGGEVLDAMWGAKEYRPDGVVSVMDVIDKVLQKLPEGAPWCFPTLTKLTYGRRPTELYGFGAGTGVGKTDLFTQQIEYDIATLNIKCGVLYLEQPPAETVRRIAGKAAGKIFHIPSGYTHEELHEAVMKVANSNNLYLYDHFGSMDWETVKSRIRFMVVGCGCKHIYLDHLTALVAGEEDENIALKGIMAELAGMAQELHCIIHYISHLTTPEGKPHEEGGRVTIRQFRGSRAIGFWTHFMFGLERNQHAEDEEERSTTILRCLKDRVTGGATGNTIPLLYNRSTGLLAESGGAMFESSDSGVF